MTSAQGGLTGGEDAAETHSLGRNSPGKHGGTGNQAEKTVVQSMANMRLRGQGGVGRGKRRWRQGWKSVFGQDYEGTWAPSRN